MHATATAGPLPVLVTYRCKPGAADALLALIKPHWALLHGLGLVTDEPARLWRATDREGQTAFIELFSWKEARSAELAHQLPEVMSVWEPMGEHLERLDIQHLEAVPA